FGGLPLAERRAELKCGLAVVDWRNGRVVAGLEFETAVSRSPTCSCWPGCAFPRWWASGERPSSTVGGVRVWTNGRLPDERGRRTRGTSCRVSISATAAVRGLGPPFRGECS